MKQVKYINIKREMLKTKKNGCHKKNGIENRRFTKRSSTVLGILSITYDNISSKLVQMFLGIKIKFTK